MPEQWHSLRFWVVFFSLLIPCVVIGYAAYSNYVSLVDKTTSAGPRSTPTLKLIAVVSRHGNRSPLFSFPNNPYPINDTKQWPEGLSQLTNFGRLQMYKLGVKVRGLYNGFLKPSYFASDVYATSTPVNRNLESGLSFLAGLYPPQGFQVWNDAIPWQPIPLYSDSPEGSIMFCPRYWHDIMLAVQNLSAQCSTNISEISSRISPYLSLDHAVSIVDLYPVWDTILCEYIEGLPLPSWTKDVLSHEMEDVISKLFITMTSYTNAMTRLLIGTTFNKILEIFGRKVNETLSPDLDIYYFSACDLSLVALQVVLGVAPEDMVSIVYPASAMVIELHQDPSGVNTVQVLFIDGKTAEEPKIMEFGGFGSSCDLDQLMNLTTPFQGVDFGSECYH